jgi:hypothetical protein
MPPPSIGPRENKTGDPGENDPGGNPREGGIIGLDNGATGSDEFGSCGTKDPGVCPKGDPAEGLKGVTGGIATKLGAAGRELILAPSAKITPPQEISPRKILHRATFPNLTSIIFISLASTILDGSVS